VISVASPQSSDAFVTAGTGSNYFATEAHYRSLADRIVTALRSGGSFVLVTGDPPASSQSLCRALRQAAGSRCAVVGIPGGPAAIPDRLPQAGSVVATLPTGAAATAAPEPSVLAAQLFVFDELDQLPERQIKDIYETLQHGALKGAAGLLLTRVGFLTRLQEPSLQFLKEGLVAQFCLQDVGQDERIEFVRHQLASRQHEAEARRISPGFLRGLSTLGALSTLGIGALLILYSIEMVDEAPVSSPAAVLSTRPAPPAEPIEMTEAMPATAAPTPEPDPKVLSAPPRGAKAQPEQIPPVRPAPASPASTQTPASQNLSPGEIAALVARGDRLLGAGDITSARLFYERAADAGDGSAALRLGATFDPDFLNRAGIRGSTGDLAEALSWYRRASDLGHPAAGEQPISLQPQSEPGPSAR
jgi:hypothetical protein